MQSAIEAWRDGGAPPSPNRWPIRAVGVAAAWVFAGLAAFAASLACPPCVFAKLLHRPCPGCGMTRAVRLLFAGQFDASLRMHPLAAPVLAALALLALSTARTTLIEGTPVGFYRGRLGRMALGFGALVYVAAIVVWAVRWFGAFGGPVPVM